MNMSIPALRLENVSKMYRLGEVGTGTLSHDLNRLWARVRGKEDPFAKVGAINDRTASGTQDFVWALRNIDFEVHPGEILGIIGRNGAGKSTLLKLLSRVTAPTEGRIYINGRIASLLEVGTGFHPELTGRENIFLNGAILGMSKREIRARFDEIVEFSGCAKYIDTPVKRYSSGMHVRLAFAVAAHLETDILIVDEVLAVGDAEFQARCIGKMKDLSTTGHRTVLFVSHNMASMRQLCPHAILMDKGTVVSRGETGEMIQEYLSTRTGSASKTVTFSASQQAGELLSATVSAVGAPERTAFTTGDRLEVSIFHRVMRSVSTRRLNVRFYDSMENLLFTSSDYFASSGVDISEGEYVSRFIIPSDFLNSGRYFVEFNLDVPNQTLLHAPEERLLIEISDFDFDQTGVTYHNGTVGPPFGAIHPRLEWRLERL